MVQLHYVSYTLSLALCSFKHTLSRLVYLHWVQCVHANVSYVSSDLYSTVFTRFCSPEGILPVPWHVGHVILSLPVNSTYGNWAMSSRLPSPSNDSLSESLSSPRRSKLCPSGMRDRLLPLRDHRVPMAAPLACKGRRSNSLARCEGVIQATKIQATCEWIVSGGTGQLGLTENVPCVRQLILSPSPFSQMTASTCIVVSGWRLQAS